MRILWVPVVWPCISYWLAYCPRVVGPLAYQHPGQGSAIRGLTTQQASGFPCFYHCFFLLASRLAQAARS